MNVLSIIMAVFAVLGAIDYVIGNRLGIGKEFETGASMMSVMLLSMVGMILFAPVLANLLLPLTQLISKYTPFDPSVLSGMILANDMGGAPLCAEIAQDGMMGAFNGLVVGATLGATVSYTIPFSLGVIDKELHTDVLIGILCGIVTVPLGCLVSGLILKIPFKALVLDLVPIIVFSIIVVLGLLKFPSAMVKIFSAIGKVILAVIIIGLVLGVVEFLTGFKAIPGLAPLDEGIDVIVNTTCIMMGAFPLVHILSKILSRPLSAVGKKLGLDNTSILGFVASAASFATCVGLVKHMNKKGRIANLAFAVSGAFTFAGHLAFTMATNADFVAPVVVGKLIGGISAIALSMLIYKKLFGNQI